jgi:cytochrome P450
VGGYTHFGENADELDAAIRIDLTRNVEKILSTFQDEVGFAFDQNIGECKSWTAIPGYSKMLRMISLLSSRVFVGLPLNRNENWIQTTCRYALDGAAGAHALTPYPPALRPLVAPFLLRSLKKHRALAREMMQPLADKFATAKSRASAEAQSASGGELIQYILSHYNHPVTADRLGRDQLIATFVAIHTTTICLTQVLFDLAARPEYVQPLREELKEALRTDDHQDGRLHNTTMIKLPKMDSFIRESQRVNPPGLVTMLRRVTSPDGLHLASGHVIPPGTTVGISNHMVTRSHPNPEVFDGFRFSKLREEPGHSTRHQLVSTGPDGLSFGHGTHACPGRFFAANEIKVVLAYLIQHYDIKLKDGESRPENMHRGAIVSPSPTGEVMLRKREF